MPFKSEAQRRKFHAMAGRGEMSQSTVKKWEDETPKKVKKNLPYHVKKASVLTMAQLAVASDSFDKSLRGWEKKGMDSVSIASFFDELEHIEKRANELTAIGTVGRLARAGRTAAQEVKAVSPAFKPGITQAVPKLKPRAAGMHASGAPTNAARVPTSAGVVPQSLGGNGLTKTHIKPSPTSQASSLRRSLAIGGGALGGGMMLGHMLPHQQQQQQPRKVV